MKKIAVVEDNEDNRLLIHALLENRYDLTLFESGKDALNAWEQTQPDLILLDISLPEMDGTEILALIRKMPQLKDLPCIALTAHAMAGDREKFLGLGFNDYVAKPIIDEHLLLAAIEQLLN